MPDDTFAFAARHYNRMTGYPGRIDKLVDLIGPWVRDWKVRDALDAGCGGGALMLALHRLGVTPVGLDCSESMLALAKDNVREQGKDFEFSDAMFDKAGTLFPERFDAVFALGNALISPKTDVDMDDALRGLHAALRPGGRLLFQSLNLTPFMTGEKTVISHRSVEGIHYLRFAAPVENHLMFNLVIIDPEQGPAVRTAEWKPWDADKMRERMTSVGFSDIGLYGGLDRSKYDPAKSTDLVMTGCRL